MNLLKKIRIAFLKHRVRKYYHRYCNLIDQYSCGNALSEYISADVSLAKKKVNDSLDELSEIDPSCTEWRIQ
jgi:hypothetical protein